MDSPAIELGIVAAGRLGEPHDSPPARQPHRLAEPEEPIVVEVEDLVEERRQVVPGVRREVHAGLLGLLTEVLPVSPAAHVLKMAQGREVGVGEHQGLDPLRRDHRRVHGDHRTEAVPDQPRPVDLQDVEQGDQVAGVIERRVARRRRVAVAVPAQVVGGHAALLRQHLHGPARGTRSKGRRSRRGSAPRQDRCPSVARERSDRWR